MISSLWTKSMSGLSIINIRRTILMLCAVPKINEILHPLYNPINKTYGRVTNSKTRRSLTSEERRESETKDSPDIAIGWVRDDALLQAHDCFISEPRNQTHSHVLRGVSTKDWDELITASSIRITESCYLSRQITKLLCAYSSWTGREIILIRVKITVLNPDPSLCPIYAGPLVYGRFNSAFKNPHLSRYTHKLDGPMERTALGHIFHPEQMVCVNLFTEFRSRSLWVELTQRKYKEAK